MNIIKVLGIVLFSAFTPFLQANDLFGNNGIKSSIIEKNNLVNFGQEQVNGPLDVEMAFQPDFILNNDKFEVTFNLQNKYYIYKDKIKLSVNGKSYKLNMPESINKNDPVFGNVEVFENFTMMDTKLNTFQDNLNISLQYQGCSEEFKICYPVEVKNTTLKNIYKKDYIQENDNKNIKIDDDISVNTILNKSTDANFISNFIAKENYFITLFIFLLFGLLMAFTPCIFPMVPILSGLIVKHDKNHPFILSSLYVLGIALCYASIGFILKIINFNIQIALQNIYLLIFTSLIMLLLAASMFGFVNLRMPSFIQSKLHNETEKLDKSKNPLALIGIGYLSALILSPCAVAPLAGTLLFASQYDSIFYSSALLFTLGIGSGIPLIIWGTSMKKILPKSGNWMYEVKNFIGLLLVAVSFYLLSKIIPINDDGLLSILFKSTIIMTLIAYILKFADITLKNKIIAFLIGFILIFNININNSSNIKSENAKNSFINITSLNEIQPNSKSLLYVGADWCVSCKEMEYTTFADKDVISELKNYKVYFLDITEMSESKKKILNKFNLQIAPFYVLYDNEGNQKKEIHIGYIEKSKFLEILKK